MAAKYKTAIFAVNCPYCQHENGFPIKYHNREIIRFPAFNKCAGCRKAFGIGLQFKDGVKTNGMVQQSPDNAECFGKYWTYDSLLGKYIN